MKTINLKNYTTKETAFIPLNEKRARKVKELQKNKLLKFIPIKDNNLLSVQLIKGVSFKDVEFELRK
jgi:hypothetical protein